VTTELAVAGRVRYLAVWRLDVAISFGADSAWERIRRSVAPAPAYLFVPAFSLMRVVVQQLGASLTHAQPRLEFEQNAPGSRRPSLVQVADDGRRILRALKVESDSPPGSGDDEPGFSAVSPVLIGRADARTLGHFVFLAVESQETVELRAADYRLEVASEELILIPAVWDPRYIHESNWRLLLREFDGMVA
jgi:hypothetical protein